MTMIEQCKEQILNQGQIEREEAIKLYKAPLEDLCDAANEIRKYSCNYAFDLCTIINGKSGQCSEDCKYCAQSSCHKTEVEQHGLLSTKELVDMAKYNDEKGVLRYSIVTSGKALAEEEVEIACNSIRQIRAESNIAVCVSMGLLNEDNFRKLKEAGASRVHNNLETSRRFFPSVCTTHSFEDKVEAVKAAKRAGLEVCSGGIIGMGEAIEDRIDMVLAIRELGIKSIPVNVLNPIPGTPYERKKVIAEEEVRRTIAIFRFLVPDGQIRLAGGRGLLADTGRTCFLSGANAAITGDMLTTVGISIETDKKMIQELGYHVAIE